MFKSITFPLTGSGYVFDEYEKPEKPTRYSRGCHTEEGYNKAVEEWKKELKEWKSLTDRHKHLYLYQNLAGKTFTFAEDKINVVFGPNGSGKTTILRALAGEAFCKDGFLTLGEPMQVGGWGDKTEEDVINYKEKQKRNTCEVVWTGNPVYYDNFEQTYREGYGIIGGITGSALGGDFESEMTYRLGVQTISAGQNTAFIFSRILQRLKEAKTLKALIEQKYVSQMKYDANSTWRNCWQTQIDYLAKHEDYDKEVPVSVIFDEMDKSLDITKVITVYLKLFPTIIEKTGMQIITVSHNPVVLTDEIFNSPKYNIISIDDAYTAEARVQLSQLSFKL